MNDRSQSASPWPPVSPLQAGLSCRCPRCGRGKLYKGVLTVREKCDVCGLDLSPHDSGDGPAVFVILILGPLVMPLVFWVEFTFEPPPWVHLIIWLPTIFILAILMLRPMKAILVAYHYKNLPHKYDD